MLDAERISDPQDLRLGSRHLLGYLIWRPCRPYAISRDSNRRLQPLTMPQNRANR